MIRIATLSVSIQLMVLCFAVSCAGGGGGGGAAAGRSNVPAAPTYASTIDASWSPPTELATLYAAARAGGAQSGRTLVADHALASLAELVAQRVARDRQQRTPAVRVIQALEWSVGLVDPLPGMIVTHMTGAPPLADFTRAVADTTRDGPFNTVGVVQVPLQDGSSVVVVAVSQRRVTFTLPIDRHVHAGSRVHLNGQIGAGLRSPELAITHPDGHNEHFPLGDGPEFVSQFPVPTRGVYQIELVATGDGGDTVIANFPVYVDTDLPATPEDVVATGVQDAASAERDLFQFLNEARHAAGRPPLQLMPMLTTVARDHSVDMATNHYIAHNSPRSGTPSERIHRAGLQSGTVLENVARGYNAREIHDGLMASPGHRANILSDHATHVGIGVATEPGAEAGLVVTQDFVEVAASVDVNAAPAALLEQINNARTRRGALALTARPQLSEVAANSARQFFQDTHASQQQVVDRANREVSRFGLVFRRVAVLATVVTRITDAEGLEPLFDPAIRSVGIGVAQGTRTDTQPNAVFVVFVLGFPR